MGRRPPRAGRAGPGGTRPRAPAGESARAKRFSAADAAMERGHGPGGNRPRGGRRGDSLGDIDERRLTFIQRQIGRGNFVPKEDFAPGVVERIIQGAIDSRDSKPFVKRVLKSL